MYDLIGDIHGYADKLQALLEKLGYAYVNGVYTHSERKALFIGDYIDRGPQIRETLQLVRAMTGTGSAIALMGNHEFNALCFHFQESEGGHLRKHLIKNIIQHYEMLKQFQNRQEEYDEYIEWFKTLPLYFENTYFRAVHAYWNEEHIAYLRKILVHDCLTDSLIHQSVIQESKLHKAVEETLKGKELTLPQGIPFKDKDGNQRNEFRIKWWEDPSVATWKSISIEAVSDLPDTVIGKEFISDYVHYPQDAKPVFFGHYWLKGSPALFRNNICCLDFSVAKGGVLAAYRYKGEEKLSSENFVWV